VDGGPLARFIDRKTHEAVEADLPPYRTVIDTSSDSLTQVGNEWSRLLFDGPFYLSETPVDTPGSSLVFVQSSDGNTGARNPSSLGGGDTDTHLIYEGLSRVAADAVMAGAETVRGGEVVFSVWHPQLVALRRSLGKPRHPVQVVATLRGLDLEHGLLFNAPELRVIVITVGSCAALMQTGLRLRPWIRPIVMDSPEQLRSAFIELRRQGIERLSVVGGRKIAAQLIDAGLIQDVYLTTAARPGGEPHTPMYAGDLQARVIVRKAGTGHESGVTFEHVQVMTNQIQVPSSGLPPRAAA
jgi:riboflavin biosynthesis pyrimidine reductase